MLRRLFTLMLAIACACAPVLAASALAQHEPDTCCCAGKCPCPPTDAIPPRSTANYVTPIASAAIEEQAKARRPASRHLRAERHSLIFSAITPAGALRAQLIFSPAPSVALFQAHCSLRI
ncbi:MAG: hypothetical protein ABIQ12_00855 [Opitutaceae bacterium]